MLASGFEREAPVIPAIIVHGGAGVHDPERLPRCREGCEAAARAGSLFLEQGGSALDAAEAAVRALEDDGEFNAGYGACLNRVGAIEVDAAIFDGSLRGGGVGAVPWMRHPVTLARRVLEEGLHLLLVGGGALEFGREHGLGADSPDSLVTLRARARWEKEARGHALGRPTPPSGTGDTVGALALDRQGRVAAASSTGGISFKRPGRVGDSPIPGAGLYALDGAGAATATGHGESILRVLLSKVVVDALRGGADPRTAARAALEEMAGRTGGTGGVIVLDARGRVAQARNAEHMPWASLVEGRLESGV